MTHEEAEKACKRLATEDPDRATHRWVPRESKDGSWEVVKVSLAPAQEPEGLTPETRADEKPPSPDDPRPLRDIGGPWVGPA